MKRVHIKLEGEDCNLVIGDEVEVGYSISGVVLDVPSPHRADRVRRYVLIRSAKEMAEAAYQRGLKDGFSQRDAILLLLEGA